jgi:hypothetical protein
MSRPYFGDTTLSGKGGRVEYINHILHYFRIGRLVIGWERRNIIPSMKKNKGGIVRGSYLVKYEDQEELDKRNAALWSGGRFVGDQ